MDKNVMDSMWSKRMPDHNIGNYQGGLVKLCLNKPPKIVALGMVEDAFPEGLRVITDTVTFPGLYAHLCPFPQAVEEIYGAVAGTLRGNSVEHIFTKFGIKIGGTEPAYSFARSIVKEMEEDNYEIFRINEAELKSWDPKVARATCLGTHVLSKGLLADPGWYNPQPKIVRTHYLPDIPSIFSYEQVEKNPTSNVGFWDFRPWNDPANNKLSEWHKELYRNNDENIAAIAPISLNKGVEMRGFLPPISTHARAQSNGGRMVFGVSKTIVLWLMRVFQMMQKILDLCNTFWYLGGDREHEYHQMYAVLKGKRPYVCKGDDFSINIGGLILNGDISSHDGSVSVRENIHFDHLVAEAIAKELLDTYLHLRVAVGYLYKACSVGMLVTFPRWGTISGGPETSILNSITVANRLLNSMRNTVAETLIELRKWCYIRPEKQLVLQHTVTLCQLIVSKFYPRKIFGLDVRTIHSLVEREDRSSVNDYNPLFTGDIRVIAKLSNSYGSPWFKDIVEWVRGQWKLRTPKSRLKKLVLTWINSTRKTGAYERAALSETIRLLT